MVVTVQCLVSPVRRHGPNKTTNVRVIAGTVQSRYEAEEDDSRQHTAEYPRTSRESSVRVRAQRPW